MHSQPKAVDWSELLRRVASWREAGRRVVHCHGVFDLLHIGHIRYLQRARQLGDVLVVTVTPDHSVNKGPHRPAFNEQLRLEAVAALDCVDAAALNGWPTARETILALRPAIYAKGAEFRENKTPELLAEEAAAADVGTQVCFVEELTSSSSQLINRYLSPFSESVEAYLAQLRGQYSLAEIVDCFHRSRMLRAVVVGEAMIDEYYSCSAIGQSMRAPIVSTRYRSHQRFASGAIAVANHLGAFCQQVELLTMVGEQGEEEDWIRQRLRDNIRMTALRKSESPTIVERRYRESYFEVPLFAINFLNDTPLSAVQAPWLLDQLNRLLPACDLVVVADYGHGMLVPDAIERLCQYPRFLAVTTQANAANFGLHTISKYRRCDYFSLAHRELELECRSHAPDPDSMLRSLAKRLGCSRAAVTLGQRGCLVIGTDAGRHAAPALATRVVDRIGAGDAFFAVSALCAFHQTPLEILAFLGNLAAAETVSIVGNAERRAGDSLVRSVESLLK